MDKPNSGSEWPLKYFYNLHGPFRFSHTLGSEGIFSWLQTAISQLEVIKSYTMDLKSSYVPNCHVKILQWVTNEPVESNHLNLKLPAALWSFLTKFNPIVWLFGCNFTVLVHSHPLRASFLASAGDCFHGWRHVENLYTLPDQQLVNISLRSW